MRRGSQWLGILTLLALAAVACGCGSGHLGSELEPPIVTVTVPDNMQSGVEATWRINWRGGTAPFTLGFNVGTGSADGIVSGTSASNPTEKKLMMISPDPEHDITYTYQAVVTDVVGRTGSVSGQYVIHPAPPAGQPTIDEVTYAVDTRTLTVKASDILDSSTLTVTVTVPDGLSVDQASKTAAATGPLTASFVWDAVDFIAGGSGRTSISVTNVAGRAAYATADIVVPAFVPAADTLYAIPLVQKANTTDAVLVSVITGELSNPFLYLNSVRVTVTTGATYYPGSFDIGAVDAEPSESADQSEGGLWAVFGNIDYLHEPDEMIQAADQGEDLTRLDFNITPDVSPNAVDDDLKQHLSGVLFNFRLSFAAAGSYVLGFEFASSVTRTYYSADSSVNYCWTDLTNVHEGVPNTITVEAAATSAYDGSY